MRCFVQREARPTADLVMTERQRRNRSAVGRGSAGGRLRERFGRAPAGQFPSLPASWVLFLALASGCPVRARNREAGVGRAQYRRRLEAESAGVGGVFS